MLCKPNDAANTSLSQKDSLSQVSEFQKRLYMQKLLDPPKPSKLQKSKVIAARLFFGTSSGIALGYITAKALQTIFSNLEKQMQNEADVLKLSAQCDELKKMSVNFATQLKKLVPQESFTQEQSTAHEPPSSAIQNSMRKQKNEELELKNTQASFEILFLMIITIPLCYKISKKIFKDPIWTYQQILNNFITRWPEVKPQIPEKFCPRCQELYEIYFESKSNLKISEEDAEAIVKQFAFELVN